MNYQYLIYQLIFKYLGFDGFFSNNELFYKIHPNFIFVYTNFIIILPHWILK